MIWHGQIFLTWYLGSHFVCDSFCNYSDFSSGCVITMLLIDSSDRAPLKIWWGEMFFLPNHLSQRKTVCQGIMQLVCFLMGSTSFKEKLDQIFLFFHIYPTFSTFSEFFRKIQLATRVLLIYSLVAKYRFSATKVGKIIVAVPKNFRDFSSFSTFSYFSAFLCKIGSATVFNLCSGRVITAKYWFSAAKVPWNIDFLPQNFHKIWKNAAVDGGVVVGVWL